MEKRRLGRGLDAVLGIDEAGTSDETAGNRDEVPVNSIQQNPYQPRKNFDEDELASLSSSVKNHGILQPLVVRQVEGKYQLVAGRIPTAFIL